jgi:hypothetical protein
MGKPCFLQDLLEPSGLRSFNGRDLLAKQAQTKREKTKEEYEPFLTILGTSQRAAFVETIACCHRSTNIFSKHSA